MVPQELRPSSGFVDIFAMHTRLNVQEHRQVLHPDSVYVTAVRSPPLLFESLYNYFNLTEDLGVTLEQFLDMPLEVGDLSE